MNSRIALFIGNDITAHLIGSAAAMMLREIGFEPYLFYTFAKPQTNKPPELQELFFYERTIWHEFIFPRINGFGDSPYHKTPQALSDLFFVAEIKDVNSPEFLNLVIDEQITAAVSLRCYQKFGPELINYFAEMADSTNTKDWQKYNFVNLHPGILPQYRGVFTFAHSMLHSEKEAGFSLHVIDKHWDAGPLLSVKKQDLDYGISVLDNMLSQVDLAVKQLLDYFTTSQITTVPQALEEAGYVSHLNDDQLHQLDKKQIKLTSRDETITRTCQDFFAIPPGLLTIPKFN